jgi:tRNA (guanine37-N1)-methyltransferase
MRFDVVSAAPEVFEGWRQAAMLGRGQRAGAVTIAVHDLREHGVDRYGSIDDYPFGGGAGMLLRPEPLAAALEKVRVAQGSDGSAASAAAPVILMTPAGERFDQAWAREMAGYEALTLVCGRYEGVDERVREEFVTRELSIGDFVLTGGELAAMVVIEAVARLVPGVLGSAESVADESFGEPLLEYPQYTRPAEFRGRGVPAVLLGGHHERIRLWRRMEAMRRTLERRPDLAAQWRLTEEDRRLLARIV